ncbi:MAG: response regulator [Ruminiclostridium sp.]|nr:response regulator [Ruminiclostridium sp.]
MYISYQEGFTLYRLLIVEDEEIIRRGLKNNIPWNEMDFEVVGEAENGSIALDIIPALHPDVILTDIKMPVIDGIELMSVLKNRNPDIKVVIFSGYSEFEYARKGIEFGAYYYLLKPTRKNSIKEVFTRLKNEIDNISRKNAEFEELIKKVRSTLPSVEEYESKPIMSSAVNRVITFLKENYNRKISLNEVAEYAFMSPSHFCTFFKQETGCTFIDFLSVIRIDKAKELMQNPELRVYEIADMVGYDDWNYFSKIFRKITGVNPTQYKKCKWKIH